MRASSKLDQNSRNTGNSLTLSFPKKVLDKKTLSLRASNLQAKNLDSFGDYDSSTSPAPGCVAPNLDLRTGGGFLGLRAVCEPVMGFPRDVVDGSILPRSTANRDPSSKNVLHWTAWTASLTAAVSHHM